MIEGDCLSWVFGVVRKEVDRIGKVELRIVGLSWGVIWGGVLEK